MTSRLFTVNIYRNGSYFCASYFTILSVRSKCPSPAHTHTVHRAGHFVNGCVDDALSQCRDQRVADTVAIYCADVMSKFFRKGAWPVPRDPPNFWALNANSSKTIKAMDFKFETIVTLVLSCTVSEIGDFLAENCEFFLPTLI